MNLEKLIEKIEAFKASHPEGTFEFLVQPQRDLDDLYAELLILDVTTDAEGNATARDEEALITLENPSNDELAMLEGIAESLKQYL
ncbi:MAG: hypothetical protein GX662_06455 [Trichococcus flocculiformis]|jgi:hypothetical protein|uniref:Uncharacterized protein n=1 Tax=Trichococcus flocculiformis TaxID=82803 RepID=A0A847D5Y0_9LACT|nr:hypothetical protein [Trichococcus flocculiformis]NCB66252.1 hypothetical protein [Bacilli bacterium]NLD31887.1 hypothetical protein [Trichococcus flocculiformis]HBQ62415.1 hypothetical protein [Trichococcus sp.]HRK98903.1 hypothetical protein [Trichococcus flocculiformis]